MQLCSKPRGACGIEPEIFQRRGQLLSCPPTTGPNVLSLAVLGLHLRLRTPHAVLVPSESRGDTCAVAVVVLRRGVCSTCLDPLAVPGRCSFLRAVPCTDALLAVPPSALCSGMHDWVNSNSSPIPVWDMPDWPKHYGHTRQTRAHDHQCCLHLATLICTLDGHLQLRHAYRGMPGKASCATQKDSRMHAHGMRHRRHGTHSVR